ncbi:Protein Yippee-Like 4 [Manis pentadactyla]|nr:Protein Yippee-Like 4 [Manis pentadactyla]
MTHSVMMQFHNTQLHSPTDRGAEREERRVSREIERETDRETDRQRDRRRSLEQTSSIRLHCLLSCCWCRPPTPAGELAARLIVWTIPCWESQPGEGGLEASGQMRKATLASPCDLRRGRNDPYSPSSNLLRCFTCDRLCGGCTAPAPPARQGIVLQPAMPSCDPGPGPACLPTKTFRSYLPRCHRTYSCVHCRAHLARHDELISKSFQGSHGRAYLFNSVVNVGCGPAEQRLLLTGLHSVADIFCESCKTTLGWKYEQAFETSQKYKEGKYIIEMSHMVKDNGWD